MAFSFKSLFQGAFADSGSVVGVDIGGSSIKVVQVRKEKERAILETYGEIALAPYANLNVGQAAKLSDDKVVTALKDVLREANIKARRASVAVPLKSSFLTVISIPEVDGDLSEIIKMEARKYIPVPLGEVNLDWWVLPEKEQVTSAGVKKTRMIHVLLAAIHKNTADSYKAIIQNSGLNAVSYEIESFSMVRSCIGKESAPVAVLDFGASFIKLAIIDYGIIKASNSIGRGAQELTLSLAHSLNVDFNKAEELKREIGLSDLPEHREMVAVMEPILEYVFSEVDTLIKDFQRKYQRAVGKVVLVGGGSLLKGLVDFAVKRLTIAAELGDPFNKVEYPAIFAGVLKETGANFSIALGAALRAL